MADVHDFDIAIVGMGPAGLYTAWRLSQLDPDFEVLGIPARKLRVGIFDTLEPNRVGGRLCTQPLPGYPFLTDLGGMRYSKGQRLVCGLVKALGLNWKPFNFPLRSYSLRDSTLPSSYFNPGASPDSLTKHPYHLAKPQLRKEPAALILEAIKEALLLMLPLHVPAWFTSPHYVRWGVTDYDIKRKIPNLGIATQAGGADTSLSLREWDALQKYAQYRGAMLYETGFWDLLQYHLTPEEWRYVRDGMGYESIMGNWNAAIAIPWFITDFSSAEYRTLDGGMSTFPRALHRAIESDPRSGIFTFHYEWDLKGVALASAGESGDLLRLSFERQPGVSVQQEESVHAKAVVLALPKGALVRLAYDDQLLDRSHGETLVAPEDPNHPGPLHVSKPVNKRLFFSDLLNSVDSRPLFKLFLGYRNPWWEVDGENGFKILTDLPLRQVYFYSKQHWDDQRAKSLGLRKDEQHHSMIMASYSDSYHIEFWSELPKPPSVRYFRGDRSVLKSTEAGVRLDNDHRRSDLDVLNEYGATARMILRAERQLGLLFQKNISRDENNPEAEVGLYMEWSKPPFYGGWHSWKLDVQPWKVVQILAQPFSETNLHICGEAYSNEQGWIEGALKSAERVVSQKLKLPFPALVDSGLTDTKELMDYLGAVGESAPSLGSR